MASATTPQPIHIPLSWRWTAEFGRSGTLRLLLVGAGVAGMVALCAAWFVGAIVSPMVDTTLSRLPADSEIRGRRLHWTGSGESLLLDARILTLEVVPAGRAIEGRLSDVHVQLRERGVMFNSLFGYLHLPYPSGWSIALNSTETIPIWRAWQPFLVIGVGVAALFGTGLMWLGAATTLLVPVRLGLYFVDREVTLFGCWRVIVAALFPGALLLAAGVVGYGLGFINLAALLILFPMHLLLDAFWLGGACWRLPLTERRAVAKGGNPFKPGSPAGPEDDNVFRKGSGAGGGT